VNIRTCESQSFKESIARDQAAEWMDVSAKAFDLMVGRMRDKLNDETTDKLDKQYMDGEEQALSWRAWEKGNYQ